MQARGMCGADNRLLQKAPYALGDWKAMSRTTAVSRACWRVKGRDGGVTRKVAPRGSEGEAQEKTSPTFALAL
jgi:hypothetical protein